MLILCSRFGTKRISSSKNCTQLHMSYKRAERTATTTEASVHSGVGGACSSLRLPTPAVPLPVRARAQEAPARGGGPDHTYSGRPRSSPMCVQNLCSRSPRSRSSCT